MDKARFMEAVAAKVGKRKPMMRRKGLTGSAPSVVIAIGAPKKPLTGEKHGMEDDEEKVDHSKMSKAEHIAYLQEKIASLKAELALLEDEEESEDTGEEKEPEMSEYEDEDED